MSEEESAISSMPYYQPTVMPSEKADLFDKIRPEEIVEMIKQRLMGKEYDKVREEWYTPKWRTRGLSEQGASEIATLLLGVASKNVAISKLDDAEIRIMTTNTHNTAMKMCIANWREYAITSPDQIALISRLVTSIAFITLKQPEKAGIRQLLMGTTQESKVISESQAKGGIASSIFRR